MISFLIIGVGNGFRSDDGVGPVVAQHLRQLLPGVVITEASGEGAALMELWKGAARVILIDAVQSGAAPGTIHRLDVNAQPLPATFFRYSTHAFGVAEAIEMARALGQLPPHFIVYGIEGKTYAAGIDLSSEVEQAMHAVVAQVQADVSAVA